MAELNGGEFLADLLNKDVRHGMLLQNIIRAVNATAKASGVAPVGQASTPPPIDGHNIAVGGEMLHVNLVHNAPINRQINYFSEISTNPQFTNIVVSHDHGASRTSAPFNLPTKDGNANTQNYYLRSFTQYPGGKPSAPVVYGGAGSPAAITMGGSTHLTLLPSTGSGTAPGNGQSAGQGFGKQFTRPAIGPKRSI
jgi:hypothetical protein